jgi:hypothetical protein
MRFKQLAAGAVVYVAEDGASISVGLAALGPDDSLQELTARGDAALPGEEGNP